MTESEWLAATDPTPMLEFLRGKASDRKLRMVAVASCYRIWDCFADVRSRAAIETAERFADGRANRTTLVAVRREAELVPRWGTNRTAHRSDLRPLGEWASETALSCSALDAYPPHGRPAPQQNYFTTTPASAANVVAARRLWDVEDERLGRGEDGVLQGDDWPDPLWNKLRETEYTVQAILVRDIFGNPFRPVTFDPSCAHPPSDCSPKASTKSVPSTECRSSLTPSRTRVVTTRTC